MRDATSTNHSLNGLIQPYAQSPESAKSETPITLTKNAERLDVYARGCVIDLSSQVDQDPKKMTVTIRTHPTGNDIRLRFEARRSDYENEQRTLKSKA